MIKRNVLVLSETIFSDRLFYTMRFAEMDSAEMVPYTLANLKNFESDYKKFISGKKQYALRWKIVCFWRQLARYIAPAGLDATSLEDHYMVDCLTWGWRKKFLIKSLSQTLKISANLRKLIFNMVTRLIPLPKSLMTQKFGDFDAVIVFSLGNLKSASILPIVKYFNSRSKPVIAYIQSWDNPTTKGYRSIQPDKVLCWSNLMSDEVASYMDIEQEKIKVIGVPIFGNYASFSKPLTNHILLATKSPKSYMHNSDLAALIGAFAKSLGMQLTVRIHPLALDKEFSKELLKMKSYATELDFTIIYPNFDENGVKLSQEYEHKATEIFDKIGVFISIYSTMNLEAVNAGKETINIDFELGETISETGRHNIIIDRRQIHNQRALSYGAIQNVQSVGALYQALQDSWKKGQEEDSESRAKLIEAECRPTYDPRKVNKIISEILER